MLQMISIKRGSTVQVMRMLFMIFSICSQEDSHQSYWFCDTVVEAKYAASFNSLCVEYR